MAISPLWRKAETPAGSGWRNARIVGAVLVVATLTAVHPVRSKAQESPARLFAAHALALRTAGVAGDKAATEVLADMPGSGMVGDPESLPVLWSPFFENTMVKLGRLLSSAPVALYYNPLLDVAMFTLWERHGEGYRVVSARALPGERLADRDADAPAQPQWTAAQDGPVQELVAIAATRMAAFGTGHPEDESSPGSDRLTFAAAARDMRAALRRIAWNAIWRSQWAEGKPRWLAPTLTNIEKTLATRDAMAITKSAPGTDAATADALASLPSGFLDRLVLDMVLDAAGGERLLIGSLTEDGDMYVLVLCSHGEDSCVLRRFVLVSLSE